MKLNSEGVGVQVQGGILKNSSMVHATKARLLIMLWNWYIYKWNLQSEGLGQVSFRSVEKQAPVLHSANTITSIIIPISGKNINKIIQEKKSSHQQSNKCER